MVYYEEEEEEGAEKDAVGGAVSAFQACRELLGEDGCCPPSVDDIEVPKVLGDLVEALLGAVFLDSGEPGGQKGERRYSIIQELYIAH